jgi:hypothetical protein
VESCGRAERRPDNGRVTLLRALLLIALGAAAAVAVDRLVLQETTATGGGPPPVSGSEPGPGDPPVVWVDGTLERITGSELVVRVGRGPRLEVERFAAGATRFLRLTDGEWSELAAEEVEAVRPGGRACVETLLDGRTFLAIRVFLSAGCGPALQAPGAR